MITEVYEICPHCDNEVGLMWDIESDGYQAFCPYCGKRLMLCSECPATAGTMNCDYDRKEADRCSMMKRRCSNESSEA